MVKLSFNEICERRNPGFDTGHNLIFSIQTIYELHMYMCTITRMLQNNHNIQSEQKKRI